MERERLEIRNVSFEMGERIPRQWHPAGAAVTTFFNGLSIFFPVGERFFIASLRPYQRQLNDETLAADVRLFCGQEGIHGREHTHYNAMLAAQGYPVAAMEERVAALLARTSQRAQKRAQLAVTCALEHFTALLARMVLADPRLLEGAHPTMAALWRWHAAEETEHKSVAFDVYRSVGGTYAERVIVMVFTTVIFTSKVLEHQVRLMKVDGALFSIRGWASLFRFLILEPGGIVATTLDYLRYFAPGFHPHDIDTHDLLANWRKRYGESTIEPRARLSQPAGPRDASEAG